MNKKIIKDISWIITLLLAHISFIHHICRSNQLYQKLKINQRVENERNRQWHQILTWKTFEEIKNHGPTTDRKYPLWKTKLNTRFYLAQAYQSLLNNLTSTFHFQVLIFFWNTLGVHTKLDLDLFFNPHKKKLSFYPNPNRLEIEIWMNKESTHFFLRKSM